MRDLAIRRAGTGDVDLLAEHFRCMWLEIGWHPDAIRDDWPAVVAAFVERGRAEAGLAAFVAEVRGAVAGSAACQIASGLYPEIRKESAHRGGYIWGVYVRPEHRRRGVATQLTRAALDHLASLGCTRATLHASAAGEPVYRAMGFEGTNERSLSLERHRPQES